MPATTGRWSGRFTQAGQVLKIPFGLAPACLHQSRRAGLVSKIYV